jgi:Flp pilus assembly protein TadG
MQLTLPAFARRFAADKSGTSLLEFALGMPIFLTATLWGVELTNLAITNQRLSQLALELADNASRVGLYSGQASVQLREVDLNDVLQSTRFRGQKVDLTTRGRVILSSLEKINGTQRIHWQRCIGTKKGAGYDSSYGTTSATAGTTNNASDAGTLKPAGMGDAGAEVNAPNNSGVMFVEINYLYTPLVGKGWFAQEQRMHYVASFIVRDNRDFAQIYNPSPAATRSTCDLYNS